MINHTADFIDALTSPDRRYGEVPFYWWNGGELDKKRISDQIKMLAEKGIAGVQINYAHINGGGEDNLSYGGHGKSIKGSPEQFTDEWWEFFSHAAKECEKYGMSIGMGDYTIAWIGNGYFTDKIANNESMNAENLSCEKKMLFAGDEECTDSSVLFIITYPENNYNNPEIIYEKGKGVLSPIKSLAECFIVRAEKKAKSIDPLNPLCGKMLCELYFSEFERRIPDLKEGTLNYFFQDELMFGTDVKNLWRDNLRDEIQKKYGYDISGFIPHLFYNLSDITAKIRLDTADVRTEIIEKSYFVPIFEYHNKRGLIYGCDQSSRGKEPDEFSDYFRTVRWFTAPGNDTPGRAADLIKVKVNSSIAHLYKRPRVWLEGYHSSGWGTTLESITDATSDNFIYGANLLNLHGLYYSTNGGFFEWAPPDFHFRMPYWDDEKKWLDKYKRLSALLCTGNHRCDAAVYYPVSSCDYGENHKFAIEKTFGCAEYIFSHGIDFDFIDFQSIENSTIENGRINISDEEYRVLIFSGIDCIRYSCIKKAKELLESGGCVIFCGITPYASDRKGLNDEILLNDIEEILSHPNAVLAPSYKDALTFINSGITRSFLPEDIYSDDKVYVHTRIHGDCKLFFVRYAPKDSVCRFEAKGSVYALDIYDGEIIRLTGTVSAGEFTFVKMPFEKNYDTLLLFTQEELVYDREINTADCTEAVIKEEVILDGEWDFSIVPTLDNTYGDYYMPKGDFIGAEARFFDVARTENLNKIPEKFEFTSLPFLRSEALRIIHCENNRRELSRFLTENEKLISEKCFVFEDTEYTPESISLHDRYYYNAYDYTGSLYEQGHHGLKGKLYDDNIYFDKSSLVCTYVYSEYDTDAFLITGDIKPEFIILNGKEVTTEKCILKEGKNLLIASFLYNENEIPNYRNSSKTKRTSIHIVKENAKACEDYLCVSSFCNSDYFRFSKNSDVSDIFCLHFRSVPAFEGFDANIKGRLLKALNNGEEMNISEKGKGNFGGTVFSARVKNILSETSDVYLFIQAPKGYEYTAFIPEPIKLHSGKGKITCGNLADSGALISFSGKAVYEKNVTLSRIYPEEKFFIDIENAASTLNIEINGKTAAVFTYKPFRKDITEFIKDGENHIKITVSNTLCNHYSTIPSKYSNFPQDASWGLMSPVRIIITE